MCSNVTFFCWHDKDCPESNSCALSYPHYLHHQSLLRHHYPISSFPDRGQLFSHAPAGLFPNFAGCLSLSSHHFCSISAPLHSSLYLPAAESISMSQYVSHVLFRVVIFFSPADRQHFSVIRHLRPHFFRALRQTGKQVGSHLSYAIFSADINIFHQHPQLPEAVTQIPHTPTCSHTPGHINLLGLLGKKSTTYSNYLGALHKTYIK